jgi:hypothetical protein
MNAMEHHKGSDVMISPDRKSRNMNAATLTDATRSALGLLIEKEERRVGSRDVAFDVVAQTVGASSSWLKKFLSCHSEVKEPRITLFLNIRAAYEALCNRVEQEHRLEEARIAALRKALDAPVAGFIEMVASTPRKATSRT